MLIYFSQIFLFLGVLLLVVGVLSGVFSSHELKTTIKRRLKFEFNPKEKRSMFVHVFDVFAPINFLVVRRFGLREKLGHKLFGARVRMGPEQFWGAKELLGLTGLFLALGFLPKEEIVMIIGITVLAFYLPDLWLNMKLGQRKAAVVRSLPDTVDLLALCVDAGLDFMAAGRWIVDKSKPTAFLEELAFMLHEIKVGKSRREALKDLSRRINVPDVVAFSRTLVQADRMGTPIAEALAILSEDSRQRHFRRAEREALQSPMKMLIPLIFFILPVVAVIVGGPIAIQFMQGGLFGGVGGM